MFAVEGSRHKEFYNCQMLLRTDIQARVASYDYLLLFNWCALFFCKAFSDKFEEKNHVARLAVFFFRFFFFDSKVCSKFVGTVNHIMKLDIINVLLLCISTK